MQSVGTCPSLLSMKSAYELAMERLGGGKPSKPLTPDQKARLAELDSVYRARIAQEDLSCQEEVARFREAGDPGAIEERQTLFREQRRRLEQELEEKKERIRGE